MRLVPVLQRDARAFVNEHHRHNPAPRGSVFQIGLEVEGELVGVIMCGRPVARRLQDGYTLEVNRNCINGYHKGACSKLLSAAWRVAKSLGYKRIITYTLPQEGGSSLRGAGWTVDNVSDIGNWNNREGRQQQMFANTKKIRWIKGEPFPQKNKTTGVKNETK